MSTDVLFSSSIGNGQHLYCLVHESLSLGDALDRCHAKGIRIVNYSMHDGRWLFKVMRPETTEVES